jgi:SAM-dependent methyltransferase
MVTISESRKYADMQKKWYLNGTSNHEKHNENPDYWAVLLKDVAGLPDNSWGLDFGCGKGRNVANLHTFGKFSSLHGIDISPENILYCKNAYDPGVFSFFENNGLDLSPLEDGVYDFAMSTIVFQHIAVHEIRFNLMKEIFRVLKCGGIFSFQMGFGSHYSHFASYYDNKYDADGTNGVCDVTVTAPRELIDDLKIIGFVDIETSILDSFDDSGHPFWIYVSAKKR